MNNSMNSSISQRKMTLRSSNGYLTVFLSLLLASFLAFIMILSEGIKKNTTLTEAEIAMDTACYSALAEYHQELLSQYDLLFIDSSYGYNTPGAAAVGNHIKEYAAKNLTGTDFMDIGVQEIRMEEVSVATDNDCDPIRQQIVEYMKKELSLDLLEEVLQGYQTTCKTEFDQNDILKQRDKNKNDLDNAPNPTRVKKHKKVDPETGKVSITEEIEGVPIVDPAAGVNQQRNAGILNWVVADPSSISCKTAGQSSCFTHRSPIIQGTGTLLEDSEQDNMVAYFEERALINQYLFEKCGYYGHEKENSHLCYQIEYLIAKQDSDMENLKTVVAELSAIREAANAVYLYSDAAKMAEITALASTVAAVSLAPYLQPIIETSILFAWAYVESIQDIKILLDGGSVPLIKTGEDWHTSLTAAMGFQDAFGNCESSRGLNYRGYLTILLAAQTEETQLEYLTDLMEMDIRETRYNENFRMDGCINGFRVIGSFHGTGGYECSINRVYSF